MAQGDDLQYVFSDLWGKNLPMSPDDLKFSKNIFVPLLANFAKTGYIQYNLHRDRKMNHFYIY